MPRSHSYIQPDIHSHLYSEVSENSPSEPSEQIKPRTRKFLFLTRMAPDLSVFARPGAVKNTFPNYPPYTVNCTLAQMHPCEYVDQALVCWEFKG